MIGGGFLIHFLSSILYYTFGVVFGELRKYGTARTRAQSELDDRVRLYVSKALR